MALQKCKVAAIQVRGQEATSLHILGSANYQQMQLCLGRRNQRRHKSPNDHPLASHFNHVLFCVSAALQDLLQHPPTVQCLRCECLLLACRLLPSLGTIEEYAGQSCKDIRDAMSNDCQQPPLSGPYYINTTDTCTGNKETIKVSKEWPARWLRPTMRNEVKCNLVK